MERSSRTSSKYAFFWGEGVDEGQAGRHGLVLNRGRCTGPDWKYQFRALGSTSSPAGLRERHFFSVSGSLSNIAAVPEIKEATPPIVSKAAVARSTSQPGRLTARVL